MICSRGGLSQECTFTLDDIPVPDDFLIVGDVRKNQICQSTSFNSSRPPDLFNPNGLRMWTREEHVMATSPIPALQKLWSSRRYFSDHFVFGVYVLLSQKTPAYPIPPNYYQVLMIHKMIIYMFHEQYIQVPKTGSSSVKGGFIELVWLD